MIENELQQKAAATSLYNELVSLLLQVTILIIELKMQTNRLSSSLRPLAAIGI